MCHLTEAHNIITGNNNVRKRNSVLEEFSAKYKYQGRHIHPIAEHDLHAHKYTFVRTTFYAFKMIDTQKYFFSVRQKIYVVHISQ